MLQGLRLWLLRILTKNSEQAGDYSLPTSGATAEVSAKQAIPSASVDQPFPFDENLLERSRTQWQFGDWQSLAALSRETLQHHPDRAKLALLAATGRIQNGQEAEARQYICLARDWGASNKIISQVLVAGVHNSLGRASLINGQQQRALKHFESAIATGTPGEDVKLLGKARSTVQHQLINASMANHHSLLTDFSENLINEKKSEPFSKELLSLFQSQHEENRAKAVEALHKLMSEEFSTNNLPPLAFTTINHENKPYYFVHFADDHIPKKIAATGKFYEHSFLAILAQFHKNDNWIIDCGANIGNHSIYFAGVMDTKVISFEPQPYNKFLLDANIALNNLENLILPKKIALSSEAGKFDLAMAIEGNFGTFTSDMEHVKRARGTEFFEKYEVLSSTIDQELGEYSPSISIIKLDIEGMEISALKGAIYTIKNNHPIIAIECFTKSLYDEIRNFLTAYGYFTLESTNATPTFIFLSKENPHHLKALMIYLERNSLERLSKNKEFNK